MEVQQKICEYEESSVRCEAKGCSHFAVRVNKFKNLNLCMFHHVELGGLK